MPDHLILRLKAPIASVGAVSGEVTRRAGDLPTRSMAIGLIGNALGLDRTRASDMRLLGRLQDSTAFAVLMLSAPGKWVDPQNARAPAECLDNVSDRLERGGRIVDDPLQDGIGDAREVDQLKAFLDKRAQQREKHYLTDLHALVALTAPHGWIGPLGSLVDALRRPARPLWIGRKACPPSAPICPLQPIISADSGPAALAQSLGEPTEREAIKALGRAEFALWWEGSPEPGSPQAASLGISGGFPTKVMDRRDWVRGLHVEGSVMLRGSLTVPMEMEVGCG